VGVVWARITRTHGDPALRDRAIALINEEVIPGLRQVDGFRGGYWLVNSTGDGVAVVLFENEDLLKATEAAAELLRQRVKELGVTVDSVETFEVVAQA
jgi:hypothetical protein